MIDATEFLCDDNKRSEYVEKVAQKVFASLSRKNKKLILEHPSPEDHHFGLGASIRNTYIYKELKLPGFFADMISEEIVRCVVSMVTGESDEKE